MKGFLFKTGSRATFPRSFLIDRGGDPRICKFGSKSIGFDKVFIKVLARSPNLEIRAQDSNLRIPNPGIQAQESKPWTPTQEINPRNELYGIELIPGFDFLGLESWAWIPGLGFLGLEL